DERDGDGSVVAELRPDVGADPGVGVDGAGCDGDVHVYAPERAWQLRQRGDGDGDAAVGAERDRFGHGAGEGEGAEAGQEEGEEEEEAEGRLPQETKGDRLRDYRTGSRATSPGTRFRSSKTVREE